MDIVVCEFRTGFLVFLWSRGSSFSDFLGFENKVENEAIVDEIPNPTFWIWWGRSAGFWVVLSIKNTEAKNPNLAALVPL